MRNNISINFNKNYCCGCTACSSICPQSAISMLRDDEGFFYPLINDDTCINCGLCVKVCVFKEKSRGK